MMNLFVSLVLLMAAAASAFVVPTGQFCPHRSVAWYDYMDHLEAVSTAHQKLLITVVSGDPASDLEGFLYEWERLAYLRETSPDYQLREYCSEPHLFNRHVDEIRATLVPFCRDLLQQLRFANPDDDHADDGDLLELQRLIVDTSLENAPVDISASPFTISAFASQPKEVQLEVLKLLDDHKELIEKGSGFGAQSKSEQNRYLDEVRRIEEQWTIAFTRFQLMDPCGINPEYDGKCHEWLAELGLNEEKYKTLHAENLNLGRLAFATGISFRASSREPTFLEYLEYSENAFQ